MNEQAKSFLRGLSIKQRAELASRCGICRLYINNMIYSGRKPSPLLACKIEKETLGMVSRRDLRPDLDWDLLHENKSHKRNS